jgi:hypothetical protein
MRRSSPRPWSGSGLLRIGDSLPASGRAVRGNRAGCIGGVRNNHRHPNHRHPVAGLDPAIHVFFGRGSWLPQRRGCPGQARARGFFGANSVRGCRNSTGGTSPDCPDASGGGRVGVGWGGGFRLLSPWSAKSCRCAGSSPSAGARRLPRRHGQSLLGKGFVERELYWSRSAVSPEPRPINNIVVPAQAHRR